VVLDSADGVDGSVRSRNARLRADRTSARAATDYRSLSARSALGNVPAQGSPPGDRSAPDAHHEVAVSARTAGICVGCKNHRRLVAPPGPHATTCAVCAGAAGNGLIGHVCAGCGGEDKLFERG